MSVSVTIEGTTTPAAGVLARGERRTVALTERVQRLVDRGFVRIIERRESAPVVVPDPVVEPDPIEFDEVDDEVEVPAGNASRDAWLEFLFYKGIEVPVDEDGDYPPRDGLKHLWQQVSGGA